MEKTGVLPSDLGKYSTEGFARDAAGLRRQLGTGFSFETLEGEVLSSAVLDHLKWLLSRLRGAGELSCRNQVCQGINQSSSNQPQNCFSSDICRQHLDERTTVPHFTSGGAPFTYSPQRSDRGRPEGSPHKGVREEPSGWATGGEPPQRSPRGTERVGDRRGAHNSHQPADTLLTHASISDMDSISKLGLFASSSS